MITASDIQSMTPEQARAILPLLMAKALETVPVRSGDRLLTIEEAAERLKLSVSTLYRNSKDEKYPFAFKDGGQWRFSSLGIDAWIARNCG